MDKSVAKAKLEKIKEQREKEKKDRALSGEGTRSFEWLSLKDLPYGQTFRMRMLPPHPTKNPEGIVSIPRSSIYKNRPTVPGNFGQPPKPPTGDQFFFLHSSGLREEELDTYHHYMEKLHDKLTTYWEVNGYPSSDQFDDPADCEMFLVSLEAAMNPTWTTHEIPIVLYADCDVCQVQRGEKTYNQFNNYKPNTKSPVARLLQVTQKTVNQKLLELEVQHQSVEDGEEEDPDKYLASPTKGKDITICRKDKKTIDVGLYGDTSKLKADLLQKFGPDSEGYPDLEKKRSDFIKTEKELRDAVSTSWWGQYITNKYGMTL